MEFHVATNKNIDKKILVYYSIKMGKHSIQANQKPGKADKLTDAEQKKIWQENKAKANPGKANEKKEKNDAKRERRKESGSTKSFS